MVDLILLRHGEAIARHVERVGVACERLRRPFVMDHTCQTVQRVEAVICLHAAQEQIACTVAYTVIELTV